jgi:hypothetical protein
MAASEEKQFENVVQHQSPESDSTKIDRNAPAGSQNSLGAESVRDGRPSTDDSVVEAIDEGTPGLATNRQSR